jgi:hypothetical protein
MSRAIEAYLGIDMDTEHDMPETLEQMKEWFSTSQGLIWCFNDAVEEYGIPVTLIDETIADHPRPRCKTCPLHPEHDDVNCSPVNRQVQNNG